MNEERRETIKALFLEMLPKKNYHIGKTCSACNIGRRTFYSWKEDDSEFNQAVEDLYSEDIDDSEEKMKLLRQGLPKFDSENKFIGWIEKPHFQALLTHLQAKGKDRGWDNTSPIGSIQDEVRSLSDEELAKEIERISKNNSENAKWDRSGDRESSEQE